VAVRQVLQGTMLSLLEARAGAHSFHVLIEVHSLTQSPAQAAAASPLRSPPLSVRPSAARVCKVPAPKSAAESCVVQGFWRTWREKLSSLV